MTAVIESDPSPQDFTQPPQSLVHEVGINQKLQPIVAIHDVGSTVVLLATRGQNGSSMARFELTAMHSGLVYLGKSHVY